MANGFFTWIQGFLKGASEGWQWLNSKPFQNLTAFPQIQNLTPLALIGISGLIIFIGVAIVKWVIS